LRSSGSTLLCLKTAFRLNESSADVGAKRSMPHLRLRVMQKIVDHRSLATEILNVLAAGMNKERVTFHAHMSKLEQEVEPVQFAEVEIFKLLDDCVKSRNGGIPEQGMMNGSRPAARDSLRLILDHSPVEITEEDKTHVFGWGGLQVLGNVAALELNAYCQSDMGEKVTAGVDEKLLHERLNKGVVKGSCIIRKFPGDEFVLENVVVFRGAKLAWPSDNRARVFAILMNSKEQSHAILDIKSKRGTEGMIS
jgi:hypothetical protein